MIIWLGCGMLNVEVDLTITLCVTVVSFLLCSSFTGSISLSVTVLFNAQVEMEMGFKFQVILC